MLTLEIQARSLKTHRYIGICDIVIVLVHNWALKDVPYGVDAFGGLFSSSSVQQSPMKCIDP